MYEGYGPHGTAVLVQALTDNRNRTVSDVRRAFVRHGGNLGSDGCVAWMFSRKGLLLVDPGDEDPEEVMLTAIDTGAEDVDVSDDSVEIYTEVEDFAAVRDALTEAYASNEDSTFKIVNSQLAWRPQSTMALGEKETIRTMKLLESLEELDDVQDVFSNLDIQDEAIAKYEAEAA